MTTARRKQGGLSNAPQTKSKPIRLGDIPWEQVSARLHWATATTVPTSSHARWMLRHSHQHSYEEIVVCLQGEHVYGLNSQAVQLLPGSALSINRHLPHDSTYSLHQKPCVDFWMHFCPGGPVAMKVVDHHPQRALKQLRVPCPEGQLLSDLRRAATLLDQATAAGGISHRKTEGFLTYVLQSLFEKLAEGIYRAAPNHEAALVESIKNYARRNLGDPLTLEDLARVAGYSPFHFHRMFSRIEGISPRLFVLTKRLEFACKLLKEGYSITSVALDAGFTDSSQFDRTFKRHFKETPGRWRDSTDT